MKKFLALIPLTLLFFIGCQDDNSILEPTNNEVKESSIFKGRIILPTWITLPEPTTLAKLGDPSETWTVTNKVPSNQDTKLVFNQNYKGGIYGSVKLSVTAIIYAGTFKEDTYVTMNVNEDNGTVSFDSPQALNRNVELYITFEGIDLRNIENDYVSFGYLASDASIQQAKFSGLKVDTSKGTLELYGGMVTDLTTYGWTVPK